jgi:hypothetical protein
MTLTKTKTELQGRLSEVMSHLTEQGYAPIALMAKEVAACMMATGVEVLEFTPELYERVGDVEIKLSTDGDKVFIEIIKEESQ